MIPSGLTSLLANRKKFIDENCEASEGQGQQQHQGGIPGSEIQLRSTSHGINFHPRSETGYVGLINQGATCYLNSFLQSLYMLPEFRLALYSSHFPSPESEGNGNERNENAEIERRKERNNSLPNQLQRLFLNLQFSFQSSLSTISLTKSFGWTSHDSFVQQDIQECMTVIFEYLCHHYSDSEIALFLRNEWCGESQNGLICSNCLQVRWRQETFRDLQIQVTGMKSLEESLQHYFLEEVIEGVDCDHCQGRHQHVKTGKFTKLPYILSLQLRRFDMNWATLQR